MLNNQPFQTLSQDNNPVDSDEEYQPTMPTAPVETENQECRDCETISKDNNSLRVDLRSQRAELASSRVTGFILSILLCAFVIYILWKIPFALLEGHLLKLPKIETQFHVTDILLSKGNYLGHSKQWEVLSFTMNFNISCTECDDIDLTIYSRSTSRSWRNRRLWRTTILKTQQNLLYKIKWTKELDSLTDYTSNRGNWIDLALELCSNQVFDLCPNQIEGFQIPSEYSTS